MINELLKYYFKLKYIKYIAFYILVCITIYPIDNLAIPFINSKLYPLLGIDDNKVIELLIGLLICFSISAIMKIFKDLLKHNIGPIMTNKIRTRFFELIIKRYSKNFENIQSGDLLAKLMYIPEQIKQLMLYVFDNILPDLLGITTIIVIMYFKNRTVMKLYILFAIIILVINLTIFINDTFFNKMDDFIKHKYFINNKFSEKINNLFQIYINNNIENEKDEFFKYERENRDKRVLHEKLLYSTHHINRIIAIIITIIILKYCYDNLKSGKIDYSEIIFILTIHTNMYRYLFISTFILSVKVGFKQINVSMASEIKDLLNTNITGKEEINIKQIKVSDIGFKYPNTDNMILDNVNLAINKGDMIVIFGKSGSGKSTIFKLLMGFYSPTNGNITVNDTDINNVDLKYYRNQFAYVGQDTKLFDMSIMDNIKYSIDVTNDEIYAIISKYNINPVYEKLEKGLDTGAGVDGNNLSGGQRQMVLILRALLKKPLIYLFDEPTAALDPNTRTIIYNILRDIKETTIVISHDPKIAEYLKTVYYLENKKLVEK